MARNANKRIRWTAATIASRIKDRRVIQGARTWALTPVEGRPVLLSARGEEPPPLVIRCPLRGRYAVTVGHCSVRENRDQSPGTLALEFEDGERFVMPSVGGFGTFHVAVRDLKGGALTLRKINTGAAGLAHLAFERSDGPGQAFGPDEARRSPIIWGITDQGDQVIEMASAEIRDVAVGMRYHRELGFNAVSWHMYLGSCEYPTRVGTTFPLIDLDDKDHLRILSEHRRAPYVDVLSRQFIHRYDCMAQGIRLAHEQGLTYMPCMRMNNEWHADWCLGHATEEFLEKFWCPEFFMKHPEYWAQYKSGVRTGGGMDYSHAAVRRYRLGILREVMENYPAIDGMFLDLHRHPPMVSYPDAAVKAFRKRCGIDVRRVKPINENVMDPRWLKFRARYFTTFMRALKKEKERLGKRYPTVVRTATSFDRCLFECADLATWFDERLVDVLMMEGTRVEDYGASLKPVIGEASKAGVKVMGCFADPGFVMNSPWRKVAGIAEKWLEEGAAGVAFYESNAVVCGESVRRNMPQWVRSLG